MGKFNIKRHGVILVFSLVICLYIIDLRRNIENDDFDSTTIQQLPDENRYLVHSSKCRIPDLNPWNTDAKRFYTQKTYKPCTIKKLLTYVDNNGSSAVLRVDKEAEPLYSSVGVFCCYSYINRGLGELPDDDIKISDCITFENSTVLLENTVLVKCYNKQTEQEIYQNAHAFTLLKRDILKTTKTSSNAINTPSVLIVGIDSVSRLNFHRSLSKTRDFLDGHDWIEYKGYNKIDDNTFPNLMALFTGRNFESVEAECNPYKKLGVLDKCNFVWKDYKSKGYITAYAEDESTINTFTYLKKGFQTPPTDMYFRPYFQATETLDTKRLDQMTYCTGPENTGERILNLAKDFALVLKDHPSFGFFWTSSVSHNRIAAVSRMDDKFLSFFQDITSAGVLNNTIFIFLSDHGLRFGQIRQTRTGWLEERLPFLYFSVPSWFKNKFPAEYENLKLNGDRLTTPFDLYMTLQDIVNLSSEEKSVVSSQACPGCRSLFQEVEKERSCEEAAIQMHWCTCTGYKYLNPNSDLALQAAHFVIDQLNFQIHSNSDILRKCVELKSDSVISASLSDTAGNWYKNDTYLLLILKTIPETILEATVSLIYDEDTPVFHLQGSVSRLDYYKFNSECLRTWAGKKYCYCKWNQFLDMNFFYFWFEV